MITLTRKQRQTLAAFCLLLLFVWLVLMGKGDRTAERIAEAVGNTGWPAFFIAMTLLPLLGVPVTPFYLLGGAVFEEWLCLLGTAISLFVNMLLAYALAAHWMRNALQTLLLRYRRRPLPDIGSRNAWLYALAIRITPGPSLGVKNYLASLAGIGLVPYLVVSWPIAMGYATGLIVLGDSITDQHWFGVLAGITLLVILLVGMKTLRKWLQNRVRTEPPAAAGAESHKIP